MPSGPRIRANNVYGVLSSTLTMGSTTMESTGLSVLPAVALAHAIIVLDPKRMFGEPEIVVVTGHLAGNTSATITRGQYGTAARTHAVNTPWAHIAIAGDYTEIVTSTTRPSNPYEGQIIYETDTNNLLAYNGFTWIGLIDSLPSGGLIDVVTSITRPATPYEGQVIYETDTDDVRVWDGTSWEQITGGGGGASITQQASPPASPSQDDLWIDTDEELWPAGMPGTTLGYAQITAQQAAITTEVPIAGLAVTVTVPEGRRLRISAFCHITSNLADNGAQLRLKQDGVEIQFAEEMPSINGRFDLGPVAIITPTAGTHTYTATILRTGASNVVTVDAWPTDPSFLLVEDITGSSLPYNPASIPVGVLARTNNFAGGQVIASSSLTDLTGSSLNISVPAGRVLKLTAKVHFSTPTNPVRGRLAIMEGAGVLAAAYRVNSGITLGEEVEVHAVISPSAGMHTYKLGFSRDAGDSVTIYSNASEPTFFTIEDITSTPALGSGAPGSTLGYAQVTSNQTGITSVTDLTGLSVTVTVPEGRRLRITGKTLANSNGGAATEIADLLIREGNTTLGQSRHVAPVSGVSVGFSTEAIVTPSAGTHTYKLSLVKENGGGTWNTVATSTAPAFILVEDITGSVWPEGQAVSVGMITSEAWTPYTPVWSSNGTAPAIGNGTLIGKYIRVGRLIIGNITMIMGSTTTVGTGQYFWSLPVPPNVNGYSWATLGMLRAFQNGSAFSCILSIQAGSNTMRGVYPATYPTGVESYVGAAAPWTWNPALTPSIDIQFMYEAVS